MQEYGIKHMTVLLLLEDSGGAEPKKERIERSADDDEKAKNLDDRIAKIKERAEARKMARAQSGR